MENVNGSMGQMTGAHGDDVAISLANISLVDSVRGHRVDLGQEPPRALLTLIRHRY